VTASKIKVVALLARAGAGKSTAAQHLVDQHNFVIVSFAGPLKRMARDIWELSDDQLFGSQEHKETVDPRWNRTPRDCMQRLGQAARTHVDEKVWIDALLGEIWRHHNYYGRDKFVIDDCRYTNEAEAISTSPMIHGRVVRIDCLMRDTKEAESTHPSEAEVALVPPSNIAAIVVNEKTPAFFRALDKLVEGLWK